MLPLLYCNGNNIFFSFIAKLCIIFLEFFFFQVPFSNFYVYVGIDILGYLIKTVEWILYSEDLRISENFFKNSENDREKIKEILGKMDILKDQLDEVLRYNKALENQNNLLHILIQQLFSELEKRNEKK